MGDNMRIQHRKKEGRKNFNRYSSKNANKLCLLFTIVAAKKDKETFFTSSKTFTEFLPKR